MTIPRYGATLKAHHQSIKLLALASCVCLSGLSYAQSGAGSAHSATQPAIAEAAQQTVGETIGKTNQENTPVATASASASPEPAPSPAPATVTTAEPTIQPAAADVPVASQPVMEITEIGPTAETGPITETVQTSAHQQVSETTEAGSIAESEAEPTAAESSITLDQRTKPQPLHLLNATVIAGTFRTLHWSPGLQMSSLNTPVPVLVAHGESSGPVMCLTAAVHGDELNGIEIVRRILHQINPDQLVGSVIGIPIVNLDGFRRASRYMSDRRDLNRFFPGNPDGSYASRVAYSLYSEIIQHCNYLVDIHTGSDKRANLTQLRADLEDADVLAFSRMFGGMSVLHHTGGSGTLRRAATDAGIAAVTVETGGPHALEPKAVEDGVRGIKNMLHKTGMYESMRLWLIPQPVFYQSTWIRANQGGILLSQVEIEDNVQAGQVLGRVIDPITNTSSDIVAPINGRILGKALDQVVSPGFATFHLGVLTGADELGRPHSGNDPIQLNLNTGEDEEPAAESDATPAEAASEPTRAPSPSISPTESE